MSYLHYLLKPEILQTLVIILAILNSILYLTNRITKAQFMAEQMQVHSLLNPGQTKKQVAMDQTTKPLTFIFDMLDQVPIINTKIPIVNTSVPGLVKTIIQFPIGALSDILHNAPFIGSKVNE